jgi:hypothetical protein
MVTNTPSDDQCNRKLHDTLELVRRNVNILQMILDNPQKNGVYTIEHEAYVLHANRSMEEAITLNSEYAKKDFSTKESVAKWIVGDTNLICNMMTCQLSDEIEESEDAAVEELTDMLRNDMVLKPYQMEMIMRIQQRGMRRRFYYGKGLNILNSPGE